MAFETLFETYDRLIVVDVETTGLDPRRDEIIQLAAEAVYPDGRREVFDTLVQLSPGGFVSDFITQLTGITPMDLKRKGRPKEEVARDFAAFIGGNPVIAAYNAQFDLSFLFYFLLRHGDPTALQGKDKLDPLTIFRDRTPGYHKLSDAIAYYHVKGVNSHRANDDVAATIGVLAALEAEKNDLLRYINLFDGPASGKPIASVTYRRRKNGIPLYEVE